MRLEPWAVAYIAAGIVHYGVLIRAAFIVPGILGHTMRQGLLKAPPRLFLGVVLSWPLAIWRRRGWQAWCPLELLAFIVLGAGLSQSAA